MEIKKDQSVVVIVIRNLFCEFYYKINQNMWRQGQ